MGDEIVDDDVTNLWSIVTDGRANLLESR